ncbi:hypothetical protein M3194_24750 [Paenibacillus glycanilyticus]|uniref:hypothetical protein n=1 Tax=Paenibacillus glycanilyticus TaxID=126569 RepID=UPI00203E0B3D|nr:hypothetical protein [Paenibacillus glycanilyticus]MCM3630546.1 hypothetical protein [Paenibacillus glycanilyticus]
MAHHNRLVCTSPGSPAFTVSLFPAPKTELISNNSQIVPFQQQGVFHTCSLEVPAYTPEITVTQTSDTTALVQFAGNWPSHVEDVWLKIDYDGGVAQAFLNSRLLTDHIYCGQTWSIGLKDFYNELEQSTLRLTITPLRKGTVHTFVNQAQVERFEGVEIAVFHRIEVIPHYRVALLPAVQK